MKSRYYVCFFVLFSLHVIASPLTDGERLAFIRGSVPGCVSKNVLAHNISQESDKRLIESYCACHATTVAWIATSEEMDQVNSGLIPDSFSQKVEDAREQCINQVPNSSESYRPQEQTYSAPIQEHSPGQSQADVILNAVIKTIIVAALSLGVLYFFRKIRNTSDERPIKSSDETSYTETAFKEVGKIESVIILCPNCKAKYKVPQGKHLEISCKQKSCLYKWKTFT